jgi:4-hydroxybenzoate polyprenyltransferase
VAPTADPFALLPPYKPPTKGFLSKLPPSWVPYAQLMRVEQTGGLYAFYTANLVGMAWAADIASPPLAASQILYVAGASLIYVVWHRGAACIVNDIWDVEFDRKVARSRHRPVARGAVTINQAWAWYGVNVAMAGGTLWTLMPHPLACAYTAVPALFMLSVYPLFKRFTHYPQLILCQPLAWAVVISCAALGVDPWTVQDGTQAAATACLVTSLMAYYVQLDYVNACQDTVDDIKAGVKSMAVRFQNTHLLLGSIATLQISLMLTAGVLANLGPAYFLGACGGNALVLAAMATTVSRKRPDICAWWFRRGSLLIGGTLTLGLFFEYYWSKIAKKGESEENEQRVIDA